MDRKKNKKSRKSVYNNQVLYFCGVAFVSLIVGFILWAIVMSFFVPDVVIGDAVVEKVDKQEKLDLYQVIFPVKNNENKNVRVTFRTEVGVIVYKLRRNGGISPKAGTYKMLQPFGEISKEFILNPADDKKLRVVVEVGHEKYAEAEMTEKTEIKPRVTILKSSHVK
jgi:hypothetical protein